MKSLFLTHSAKASMVNSVRNECTLKFVFPLAQNILALLGYPVSYSVSQNSAALTIQAQRKLQAKKAENKSPAYKAR
jgi:hypothetical protein